MRTEKRNRLASVTSGAALLALLGHFAPTPASAQRSVAGNEVEAGAAAPTGFVTQALAPERFTLSLPAEVHAIGLKVGLRPELLYRPFGAGTATHLKVGVGLLGSPEYLNTPLDAGLRFVWEPAWWLKPMVGFGYDNQIFHLFDAPSVYRGALYFETGVGVRFLDNWEASAAVVPALAMVGPGGISLAGRAGVSYHFGAPAPR